VTYGQVRYLRLERVVVHNNINLVTLKYLYISVLDLAFVVWIFYIGRLIKTTPLLVPVLSMFSTPHLGNSHSSYLHSLSLLFLLTILEYCNVAFT